MPSAFHRSFNPYSSAPPPPSSLPDYIIEKSTTQSLTVEQAGALIDEFLASQDGKVLTLHRLADHLLGRKQIVNESPDEVEELGSVLEEERRREGGVIQVQPDDALYDDAEEQEIVEDTDVPKIQLDKKKARKEERRLKKEREREKRKKEESKVNEVVEEEPTSKRYKKNKEHKSSHLEKH